MGKKLNMSAYYYSFNETGFYAIDKILSAVAAAGAGCHNTEDWNEYGYPDKIQKAAEEATEAITKALDWACYQNCHSKRMNYGTCNQKDCPVALANNREFIGSSHIIEGSEMEMTSIEKTAVLSSNSSKKGQS